MSKVALKKTVSMMKVAAMRLVVRLNIIRETHKIMSKAISTKILMKKVTVCKRKNKTVMVRSTHMKGIKAVSMVRVAYIKRFKTVRLMKTALSQMKTMKVAVNKIMSTMMKIVHCKH